MRFKMITWHFMEMAGGSPFMIDAYAIPNEGHPAHSRTAYSLTSCLGTSLTCRTLSRTNSLSNSAMMPDSRADLVYTSPH